MEKTYKATVKNNETKKYKTIEFTARNKKEAIELIRVNGYSVNYYDVAEKEIFDYLMEHPRYNTIEEKHAAFLIKRLPESEKDLDQMIRENLNKQEQRKTNRRLKKAEERKKRMEQLEKEYNELFK